MNDAVVRAATPADLPGVVALRLELLGSLNDDIGDREALREANLRWLAEHEGRTSFSMVADDGGVLVAAGTVVVYERPPYPGNLAGRDAYLLNMYTRPTHRGRGLARRVFRALVAAAEAAGAGLVSLHATTDGLPLYLSEGFAEREHETALEFRIGKGRANATRAE